MVHEQKVKMGKSLAPGCSEWSPSLAANSWAYLNTSEAKRGFRGKLGCHPVSPNREDCLPPKAPSLRLNGILILGFLGNMFWVLFRAPPRGVGCRGHAEGPALV